MSIDFKTGINGKLNAFSKYINDRSCFDRVVGLVQFTCMTLIEPSARAGQPQLALNFKHLMELASTYRRLTRFSQWPVVLPILSPSGMKAYLTQCPSRAIGALRILATAFFTVYLLGEELAIFGNLGIIKTHYAKVISRFRIVCLFWSNVCRLSMNYLLLKDLNYDEEKGEKDEELKKTYQKRVLAVWDGILMTAFAYTLQKGARPGGPRHLSTALQSGSLIEVLTCFGPPIYVVPSTFQGLLGIASLIPGLLSSLI